MSFDSNGVFSRVMNWTSDQQNGIAIECGRHDAEDDNFAQGFNDCFCRDGRAAATGDFNLGNYKVKNLADGTATTDAVNKGQLDSGLSAKANTSDVVNLTGTQTISGTKTFSGWGGFTTHIKHNDVTYNTAPSSDKSVAISFMDKNNVAMGVIESWRYPSNGTCTQLNAYGAKGAWASRPLGLIVEADGYTWAFAPNSDSVGSIVTTEGINKAANGYVKLGNGMIIQWGRFTNTNNTFSVTLPTPFTTNNYSIAYGCLDSQRSGDNTITTNTTSTTGFTGWISCHSTNLQSQWIAIGY